MSELQTALEEWRRKENPRGVPHRTAAFIAGWEAARQTETLHKINMQTSVGSVFGRDTNPDSLYIPTALVCRILDGEE